MTSFAPKKGILALENGMGIEGLLTGAEISIEQIKKGLDRGYGEVVFNTSMTGYQEILTDPSYFGQIICMTAPHIGNTGVNHLDIESKQPWCAGFVMNELCTKASNWRSEGELLDYLIKHNIPALTRVDTRALTRELRSKGVIRGIILPWEKRMEAPALLDSLPKFEGRDLLKEVSTRESYLFQSRKQAVPTKYKVVALDFGVKGNLLQSLSDRGCSVEVVPVTTSAAEILAKKPNGVFLSNGPGDPSAAPYAAETVRALIGKLPLFGVCMGHQILAIALGGKTFKLKFGHRGGNQPVIDYSTGKVEISSHNHGYAVDPASLPKNVEVTHLNLNDKTVEGLKVLNAPVFSVQYHPEACPGPRDSEYLFDRFVESMKLR